MKKILLALFVVAVPVMVWAQDCIVPRPPVPPKARDVLVKFPNPDGGAVPCFGQANTPGGQPPREYQMAVSDCNRLKRLGDWAVEAGQRVG